ncbi:hypothetical protein GCK72_000829 [Caenorhabditis remanei]|uniref:Protein kinase domain-containing protein n=1 Tax=Caenorhabditis remanei TaxID=31234 RepID=A0A6A5HQR4_CAERE|nr:hypothetical protein GCK72_000829 [Caenorhabditis remanei]KAF1769016.1 hypothetical protein GCK72_000829 [Caenorhabditis remanei]
MEDSEKSKESTVETPTSRIDDYCFVRDLARGGFGTVAEFTSKKNGIHHFQTFPRSKKYTDQYVINRELLNATRIFHENVEKMEVSVADVLEQNGKLERYDSAKIMKSMGTGLQYCPRKGMIHRDVKPENILLGSDEAIKLGDFGVSTFEEDWTLCGTHGFMAPEVVLNQTHTCLVDSWGLGLSSWSF